MAEPDIEVVRKEVAALGTTLKSQYDALPLPILFLSIDLVDSTALKGKLKNWPLVIARFFEAARSEVKKIDSIGVWKYAGDEVLFFKQVRDAADLSVSIDGFLKASNTVSDLLRNNFPEASVQTKPTAWIANVHHVPSGSMNELERMINDGEFRNITVQIASESSDHQVIDFLGPDVDVGFRISKYSRPNVLTVSAELARVLMKVGVGESSRRIRVVAYKRLKGVWSERHYPIVWYSDNWEDIERAFPYDAKYESDVVAQAIQRKAILPTDDDLDVPFQELELHEFNERLIQAVQSPAEPRSDSLVLKEAEPGLEVHAVAVCFREDSRILVGKRPADKRVCPECWEFGCAQLSKGTDFFEAMRIHYKADFGAELEFPREDPIGRYFIQSKGIPGVIFIGKVINPDNLYKTALHSKHTELKWMSPDDTALDENAVPNFRETLDKATAAWAQLQG